MQNKNLNGFVIVVERKVTKKTTHRDLVRNANVVCVFPCVTTAATHVEKMEMLECFDAKDRVSIVHGSVDLNLGWSVAAMV
tara:strand:- start:5678 stop:5920 length:243 start_codon:yes stop_codon:yes gene_type:complete